MSPTSKVVLFVGALVLAVLIIGLANTSGPPRILSYNANNPNETAGFMEHVLEKYHARESQLLSLTHDVAKIKAMLDQRDSNYTSPEFDVRKLSDDLSSIKDLLAKEPDLKVEEVDQRAEKIMSHDDLLHNDDNSTAQDLYKQVRVLCYIPITDSSLTDQALTVWGTWGPRCNKLVFFAEHAPSDPSTLPGFTVVGLGIPDTGNYDLTKKMFASMKHLYEHYLDDYDWFMKADTDTFVIVENLRYMLSDHKPSEPVYFGHHFKVIVKNGYMSGGGGYVMSREALRRFGKDGFGKQCVAKSGTEDVEIGHCMEKLDVLPGDSRDKLGRSRFHCMPPNNHVHGGFPNWYKTYDKYGARHGMDTISDYAISFHWLKRNDMYMMEFYIYHLRPYGILAGLQQLNGKAPAVEKR